MKHPTMREENLELKENNGMVRHNLEVTLQIGMLNSDSSAQFKSYI